MNIGLACIRNSDAGGFSRKVGIWGRATGRHLVIGAERQWTWMGIQGAYSSFEFKTSEGRTTTKNCWIIRTANNWDSTVTRQLIEGKLMDIEKEWKNIQVVVQGTSEHSAIFLINENGIICMVKLCDHGVHVSQLVDDRVEESLVCSALCDTNRMVSELKRPLKLRLSSCKEHLRDCMKLGNPSTMRRGNHSNRVMSSMNQGPH